MADWKYVVEFSTMVENVQNFDKSKILSCVNGSVPADVIIVMEVEKEEILSLPFNTYSNDKEKSDSKNGGLKVYKVTDTTSFKGENLFFSICADYNIIPKGY